MTVHTHTLTYHFTLNETKHIVVVQYIISSIIVTPL